MTMTEQEMRVLKVWAIETALGLASINKGDSQLSITATDVVAGATKLVSYVLNSR